MKRAVKIIVAAMIAIFVLQGAPVDAAGLEIFQRFEKARGKKKAPSATTEFYYGVFVSGLLSSPDFTVFRPKVESVVALLNERNLKNGIDYYYTVDYLFYLPKKAQNDSELGDAIYELSRVMQEHEVRPGVTKNPRREKYLREFAVAKSGGATNPIVLSMSNDQLLSLGQLASLMRQKRDMELQIGEIELQIRNLKQNKKSIERLLRSYSNFGDLLADYQSLHREMSSILSDPNRKADLKDIVNGLFDTAGIWSAFSASGRQSDGKYLPSRSLSYEQLSQMMIGSRNDKSIATMKKYLMLLNILFLNRSDLPELKKLTANPYRDIVVMRIYDYKVTMHSSQKSYTKSAKISYVGMMGLGQDFYITVSTKKGKNAIVMFNAQSKVADLRSLRDAEKLTQRALASSKKDLADIIAGIASNPIRARYAGESLETVERELNFYRNFALGGRQDAVGFRNGDATDSNDIKEKLESDALPGGSESSIRRYEDPADIAAVMYRYGSFFKRYGIDAGNTDITAVVDSIRKKYKRKDSWKRLDVFPGDRKWILIGKGAS